MSSGKIGFTGEFTEDNSSSIIAQAIDYIQKQYSLPYIDEDSLDLSGVENGEIGFLTEAPQEELMNNASVGFPIMEVTAQSLKKK